MKELNVTHEIGDIWTTHRGRCGKEVKKTYYMVKLPNGTIKVSTLALAQRYSELAKKSVKEVD